ncbi:MAG TPA: cytochrome ubiquinol oxidase subunit I, partial [Acidimicrobiales bacterium]|nr:cytochrome ubiquinol oxidase subunit I [Acidimicrobiales bacterium]
RTKSGASFSLLTIGNLKGQPVFQIRVPYLLSLIAALSWNGQVKGINNLQAADVAKYGPGSYTPVIPLTYWSFRAMVGVGILMILLCAWGVWLLRRKRTGVGVARRDLWFGRAAVVGIALPFIANTTGWVFTEAGRQPWTVFGLMLTAKGVSGVTTADIALTLAAFVAVYSALGVVDAWLMVRAARRPLAEPEEAAQAVEAPGLVY